MDYIIPTWNSERTLEATLRSIRSHGNPNRIIIVDRNSQDRTQEIAKSFGAEVHICMEKLGAARWYGASLADTEKIVFVDDDIELPDNWWEVISYHWPSNVGAVGGHYHDIAPRQSETGFMGCTIVNKDLFLQAVGIKRFGSGEDGYFGKWLTSRELKWTTLPVSCHHNATYNADHTRWGAAGRRLVSGFSLMQVKRIVGGAIFGIPIRAGCGYWENARIRYDYMIGYLYPDKYNNMDRNMK
ncbi:glycosyltransferase family 2 protein [Candidatus Pacearchaeota archaeon]|jgi:glycosyltransferase involved in cell wall biosynthesis|nr:glycosyltransferase family 2 protein [Candidatus Pacearchaeota archaeon]